MYVTVASDHSDRSFECYGIQLSKQLYPDVLAADVWPYSELESHGDDLVLRGWSVEHGQRAVYQEAPLGDLLSSTDWLERLEQANLRQPGLVFSTGTLPTRRGLVFGEAFEIELEDPVLGRSIRHRYTIEVLGPVSNE